MVTAASPYFPCFADPSMNFLAWASVAATRPVLGASEWGDPIVVGGEK